jgi:signal transduction histidine kinase
LFAPFFDLLAGTSLADQYTLECMNDWLRVTATLAMALFLPLTSLSQTAKNVLVLHMESSRLPANVVAQKAIEETIGRNLGTQVFEEYMDENRLGTDYPTLAERIHQKYGKKKMDLVMTVGPQALNFILQYREALFPAVPIVFSVVDSRGLPPKLPQNVMGVGGSYRYSDTVDLILKLQPDTQRIFYVAGATPEEMSRRNGTEQEFEPYSGRLEFIYLNNLPLPQLLDRLGQLPRHSVVLFTTFFRDASGQPYIPARVCPLLVVSSNAPVYGTFDTLLGCGIVGGSLIGIESSARKAANLALQVLDGKSVANPPVQPAPANQIAVDWRQLKKWDIPESRLPAGTIVRYREPSAWEAHKKPVLAAVAILLLQSALIALLVIQTRRHKRSELAVRNLTRRLIEANEEESRHLARELHDDIAQRLSFALVRLDLFGSQLPPEDGKNRSDLDSSIRDLDALVSDVHNLSHRLHSSKLQHLGLRAAITELCQQISDSYGLEIDFQTDGTPGRLPQDVSLCFYRVAQEALNNVVKHSDSKTAQLTLSEESGLLRMQVRDSGVGFKVADAAIGLGLTAMQERIGTIGGRLSVESKPGEGTLVIAEATIPLRKPSIDRSSVGLQG